MLASGMWVSKYLDRFTMSKNVWPFTDLIYIICLGREKGHFTASLTFPTFTFTQRPSKHLT